MKNLKYWAAGAALLASTTNADEITNSECEINTGFREGEVGLQVIANGKEFLSTVRVKLELNVDSLPDYESVLARLVHDIKEEVKVINLDCGAALEDLETALVR